MSDDSDPSTHFVSIHVSDTLISHDTTFIPCCLFLIKIQCENDHDWIIKVGQKEILRLHLLLHLLRIWKKQNLSSHTPIYMKQQYYLKYLLCHGRCIWKN